MPENTRIKNAGTFEYVAFICCRQVQLDQEAAEMIQSRIENYIIPKELRNEPAAKILGKVFRHREELPLSRDLPESIIRALDHSKFLIVICSPELTKSKWCEAEIRYFRKAHGADHILPVLIDGDMEDAFPEQLRYSYDENDNIIGQVEPLALDIRDGDHRFSKKRFSNESARLLAPMLNRSYDELRQIERHRSGGLAFLSSIFQKKNKETAVSHSTPSADNVLYFSFSRPNQTIRFFQGDLTDTDQDYDIIVCSAFKEMYDPALFSLMGALEISLPDAQKPAGEGIPAGQRDPQDRAADSRSRLSAAQYRVYCAAAVHPVRQYAQNPPLPGNHRFL